MHYTHTGTTYIQSHLERPWALATYLSSKHYPLLGIS